jgi:uncharacterized repeat protein (TIGR01451 family)
MTRSIRLSLAMIALLVGATSAQAQKSSPTLVVSAANTTAAGEAGAARTAVRPNDVLRYTLTFRNPTDHAVSNVELRNPIPAGVTVVAGSAHASRADARLEFSADGGKSWSAEPMEMVTAGDKQVRRAIPVDRYTHIRWVLKSSVAANAVVTADFEARVAASGA